MASRLLVESCLGLIEDHIKANIEAALIDIRTDRADAIVNTELPKSYYRYAGVESYRCPMVMIVADTIDFQKERGANHINAVIRTKVAVVVEDKNLLLLNIKAWRYQAALDKILDQTAITSLDGKLKIVPIIRNATFSPEFTTEAQGLDPAMKSFQKEVILEIDVQHYEGF